ncbi:hypothetical protein A2160_00295 [Candidatus Beckwithbacteria bacterium RBG_13_42_9]|uniref:SGNH hydrolase-type esterase domain-containing protein n=1 Tax=Candidatus Beckwithbacteria bacterium RBG_13_42_9 TaxID=1797457 RepID=A0A1F5E532_9BACT|nr:MAG: hypothetical protein A2160_00295 [Candidatus Beckwithbacteria bacterium RBG_13_42_9]
MTLKHTLIIFLVGILIGVGISPLASAKPVNAFISPIPVSLANEIQALEEENFSTQVLGVKTADKKSERQEKIRSLVNRQDQELAQKDLYDVVEVKTDQPREISANAQTTTIAVYGDSMVDTMGTGLPYLKSALSQYYPKAKFNLFNYGIGAQNIETGLARFDQGYSYKDRNYPAITGLGANIIVIESFAYNPMGEAGLDSQWQNLSKMVNLVQASGAKVILLVTIAPSKNQFGQGPGGISWGKDQSWQQANLINKYLDNAVKLGNSLGIPVVDAYRPSLLSDGEGNPVFINTHDHIHPSVAGHQFVSELIAQKIFGLDLIN